MTNGFLLVSISALLAAVNGFVFVPAGRQRLTVAFVRKESKEESKVSHADSILSRDFESFLQDSHQDLQDFTNQFQELDETELTIDELIDDNPENDYLDFHEHSRFKNQKKKVQEDNSIQFGMMGSHGKQVMKPSGLTAEEEEECEETFKDFATGDELCWNGDSVEAAEISEGIHEYRTDASKNANADGDAMVSFDGGMMGSHRKPLMDPTKMAEEEEEECKEIFTDFATGDDLCWS